MQELAALDVDHGPPQVELQTRPILVEDLAWLGVGVGVRVRGRDWGLGRGLGRGRGLGLGLGLGIALLLPWHASDRRRSTTSTCVSCSQPGPRPAASDPSTRGEAGRAAGDGGGGEAAGAVAALLPDERPAIPAKSTWLGLGSGSGLGLGLP